MVMIGDNNSYAFLAYWISTLELEMTLMYRKVLLSLLLLSANYATCTADDDYETRLELLTAVDGTMQFLLALEDYHLESTLTSFVSNSEFEPKVNIFQEYVEHREKDVFSFIVSTRGQGKINLQNLSVERSLDSFSRILRDETLYHVVHAPNHSSGSRPYLQGDNFPDSSRSLQFDLLSCTPAEILGLDQKPKGKELLNVILDENLSIAITVLDSGGADSRKLRQFLLILKGKDRLNVLEFVCDPRKEMRVVRTSRKLSKAGVLDHTLASSFEEPFYEISTSWSELGEEWVPKSIHQTINGLSYNTERKELFVMHRIVTRISLEWSEIKATDSEQAKAQSGVLGAEKSNSNERWTNEAIEQLAKKQIKVIDKKLD